MTLSCRDLGLEKIETERWFCSAFQAGMVYFCWKHNCLWLGFGSTFYPPNCQKSVHVDVMPSCGGLTCLLFHDTEEQIWRGKMFFSSSRVNTVQMCCAVMRVDFMESNSTSHATTRQWERREIKERTWERNACCLVVSFSDVLVCKTTLECGGCCVENMWRWWDEETN